MRQAHFDNQSLLLSLKLREADTILVLNCFVVLLVIELTLCFSWLQMSPASVPG